MTPDQANKMVAATLSEAMAHCKSKAIDEQTVRTGLLTITIANFVNRIGKDNAIELFRAIPNQIQAGIFDRYIDQSTGQGQTAPPSQQQQYATPQNGPQAQHYQSAAMPQHYIPPHSMPHGPVQQTISQPSLAPHAPPQTQQQPKRRLKG